MTLNLQLLPMHLHIPPDCGRGPIQNQQIISAHKTEGIGLGRPEWALRTFESAQKNLHRELGIEPDLPLIELQQRARLSLP